MDRDLGLLHRTWDILKSHQHDFSSLSSPLLPMASSSRASAGGAAGTPGLPLFLGGIRGNEDDADDDGNADDSGGGGDEILSVSSSSSSSSHIAGGGEDNTQNGNNKHPPLRSLSEMHYLSVVPESEAKKVLFAMCMGLTAAEVPEQDPMQIRRLADFNVEPYLSVKNKKPFRPMHKHFLDEIQRRFIVLKIPAEEQFKRSDKRKATMSACLNWLKDHPVTNPQDVSFLRSEEKKFFDMQNMARLESTAIAGQKLLSSTTKVVLTRIADLRLVHCILHDDVNCHKDCCRDSHNLLNEFIVVLLLLPFVLFCDVHLFNFLYQPTHHRLIVEDNTSSSFRRICGEVEE